MPRVIVTLPWSRYVTHPAVLRIPAVPARLFEDPRRIVRQEVMD
jgi:hypothetical protein